MTKRDFSLYPQDNIGDALWKMLDEGDDLKQAREIEFSVIFPNKVLALKFGHLLLENNQKLSFCSYDGDKEFPWEITAYPYIVANYESILAYQEFLISNASAFEGKYDGFYSLAVII